MPVSTPSDDRPVTPEDTLQGTRLMRAAGSFRSQHAHDLLMHRPTTVTVAVITANTSKGLSPRGSWQYVT